ncbi:MAG: M24 family metallopeptidase [Planctomycetota bacterium]|nr:M24 family metallopeptidase [Planctomycetota bacterium]
MSNMTKLDLQAIQSELRSAGIDGWLLYDFRGTNPLARRVLGFDPQTMSTRRWFYFIPATGTPRKLVHRIESAALDHLPGERHVYLRWQELEEGVRWTLSDIKNGIAGLRIAMEYAPGVSNPYLSRVDAGTIEFVRSLGVEIVSSGDLVQQFEATWSAAQWQMHQQAAKWTAQAFEVAWQYISDRVRSSGNTTELDVQQQIIAFLHEKQMVFDHPPIVAVGAHSGDPHYEPTESSNLPIAEGDLVLIDLWAKLHQPNAVYSDLTQMGYVGTQVPEKYAQMFGILAAARDAGIRAVQDAFATNRAVCGWEIDDACRTVIEQAGYGEYFIHRTGHNIGTEDHGNGAHIDNMETHDQRRLLRGTCFSIEPGIYLPEYGMRSEVNVFIDEQGRVHVTGGTPQQAIRAVLA